MADTQSARITKAVIGRLAPGETVRDTEIKGFGARRQKDSISYFVKTRINGRQKWLTIGRHGNPWTPETARKEALRLLAQTVSGRDPSRERPREVSKRSFAEVASSFLSTYGRRLKPSTLETYGYLIRLQLIPAFGTRPVEQISKADVASFHAKWADKPRTANHALAVMSKIMSWCERQGLRPEGSNPCLGLERYKERRRERFLTPDELRRLGRVLDEAEETRSQNLFVVAAIRTLILTGARLSEVLTLKWDYIDTGRRLILLPDSKTGAKPIPLNQPTINLLERLPRVRGNPYVFVGHVKGSHLVNIQKPWRAIRDAAELGDLRLHDLRHSFASVAVASGGSLPVIGRILGHAQPQTTARYAHLGDDPVAQLSEMTSEFIARAMASYLSRERRQSSTIG